MVTLKIPKMSCGGCVATVEKAILSVDSAAKVQADLAARVVTVETQAAPAALSSAVKAAGYENSLA